MVCGVLCVDPNNVYKEMCGSQMFGLRWVGWGGVWICMGGAGTTYCERWAGEGGGVTYAHRGRSSIIYRGQGGLHTC